jgi:hypothetical protein
MKGPALFVSIFAAAALALPAFAADGGLVGLQWGRNSKDFDGMSSGPQPLRNLNRLPNGTANDRQLIGDYHNPILTPYAAAIVKQKGEQAMAGGFPSSEDQCRPIAPPYTFAIQFDFQILPTKDGDLTIVYHGNDQVRHIRMNGTHPAKLVLSTMGDSIGHWEVDTLVIDTVGVKVDSDYTTVDRFGTPQSDGMHVVERYGLIDGARAKTDLETFEKIAGTVGGRPPDGYMTHDNSLKGLRLEVTMEDPKAFTAPLIGVVTYRRLTVGWREDVCADNPVEHYKDEWIGLPKTERPDF